MRATLLPIKAELGFTDSELGLIGSLLFVTMALLMPVAGYVGDAYSKKWIISASIIFWSVATMLTGVAWGLAGMIVFRSIATAGGETFYTPAAVPLVAAYHQKTRAFALSAFGRRVGDLGSRQAPPGCEHAQPHLRHRHAPSAPGRRRPR